jgi:hypothetical protein
MSKKTQTPAAEKSSAAQGFPLFFVDPRPVDKERHAKAVILQDVGYGFAKTTNSIPVNAAEFVEAAKCYPIVFTNDEQPLPAVVVGLEKENYFIAKDGAWAPQQYVPAYVRKYPFVFTEIAEQKQFLLCVDEGSKHYAAKGKGVAFYDNDKPSALINQALEFCAAFHNHLLATREFCAALKEKGLLVAHQSDASLTNGRKIRLGGFQMLDEKKFNALPDATILEWKQKGWLPLVYFALASNSNWRRLADAASKREPAKAA